MLKISSGSIGKVNAIRKNGVAFIAVPLEIGNFCRT
jgi:hypothetical protein